LTSGTLEEVHDLEFDETKGSQEEDQNLDLVRGTQLVNAIKNMDVGDIWPREVIEVEDDKDQVLSNSNVQDSGSHDQNQASTSGVQGKINNKWIVHHLK
jgi:phage protein D